MQDDVTPAIISAEEFQCATSPADLKGRINLRLEHTMQQEIEDIAEDSRYPLNTVSEVVRFCCQQGVERLREWHPAPTLLGAIRAANALMARDKMQSETVSLLDRMSERLDWYIVRKKYDEAISLVAQIRSYFEGLPDDFWKEHILEEIDMRFAQYYAIIEDAKNS